MAVSTILSLGVRRLLVMMYMVTMYVSQKLSTNLQDILTSTARPISAWPSLPSMMIVRTMLWSIQTVTGHSCVMRMFS